MAVKQGHLNCAKLLMDFSEEFILVEEYVRLLKDAKDDVFKMLLNHAIRMKMIRIVFIDC